MSLSEVLRKRLYPQLPVLPQLTSINGAKKRVFDRWPNIVPDPREDEHEQIIATMLSILEKDIWDDVKLSFVLKAFRVSHDLRYTERPDVSLIRKFAIVELTVASNASLVNAMVSIYISTFSLGSSTSSRLGDALTQKIDLLNNRWQQLLLHYPALFDAASISKQIAKSMLQMESPWHTLKAFGLSDPHSVGLMEEAHKEYVKALANILNTEAGIKKLFLWLHPTPGKRKQSGSTIVIEAILGNWRKTNPSDNLRQLITESLISHYQDPRVRRDEWISVSEDYMNVIYRWLTKEDLKFFTSVVDATQSDPQWQKRKKFWLQLYDENLIEQAWVAFCPSASSYAREKLVHSGNELSTQRFAKQTAGGGRSDTSILILKIAHKIYVDGCHNYSSHVFNYDDPSAPKLFLPEYDCDLDVRLMTPLSRITSKTHSSIPAWSSWIRETMYSKIPMSTRTPRRRSLVRPKQTSSSTERFSNQSIQPIKMRRAELQKKIVNSPTKTQIAPHYSSQNLVDPPSASFTNQSADARFQELVRQDAEKKARYIKKEIEGEMDELANSHLPKLKVDKEKLSSSPPVSLDLNRNQLTRELRAFKKIVTLKELETNDFLNAITRAFNGKVLWPSERKLMKSTLEKMQQSIDLPEISKFLSPISSIDGTIETLQELHKWASVADKIKKIAERNSLLTPENNSILLKLKNNVALIKSKKKWFIGLSIQEINNFEHLLQMIRASGESLDALFRNEL